MQNQEFKKKGKHLNCKTKAKRMEKKRKKKIPQTQVQN